MGGALDIQHRIPWEEFVGEYAIRAENLTRRFGAVCAVDKLNLDVPAGIVFGFIGPRDAGKTTTIHLLLGLLAPTSGNAMVLGFDVRSQAEEIRQHTGALLEHTGLYDRLSAEENLDFYGRIWHMPSADRKARAKELLDGLGLWERRTQMVETWRPECKQRLAIARALLHRPSLMFVDEPTAGLDPAAALALRSDLASLAVREGITVFMATSRLAELDRLCPLGAVIHEGRLLAVGTAADLLARRTNSLLEITGRGFTPDVAMLLSKRPEVLRISREDDHLVIELSGDVDTSPLVSLLVESSAEVEEVHKRPATLDSVFDILSREVTKGSV